MPTAHDQSKSYLLANFIKERIGQNCSPNDINNSALLDFWLEQSSDKNESNFKLFSSVFKVGIELRKAISHRLEKLKFENASSLGKDKEAGEVDPDKIEEIVVAVENDTQPLRALAETPLTTIAFLNGGKLRPRKKSVMVLGSRLHYRILSFATQFLAKLRTA